MIRTLIACDAADCEKAEAPTNNGLPPGGWLRVSVETAGGDHLGDHAVLCPKHAKPVREALTRWARSLARISAVSEACETSPRGATDDEGGHVIIYHCDVSGCEKIVTSIDGGLPDGWEERPQGNHVCAAHPQGESVGEEPTPPEAA